MAKKLEMVLRRRLIRIAIKVTSNQVRMIVSLQRNHKKSHVRREVKIQIQRVAKQTHIQRNERRNHADQMARKIVNQNQSAKQ